MKTPHEQGNLGLEASYRAFDGHGPRGNVPLAAFGDGHKPISKSSYMKLTVPRSVCSRTSNR